MNAELEPTLEERLEAYVARNKRLKPWVIAVIHRRGERTRANYLRQERRRRIYMTEALENARGFETADEAARWIMDNQHLFLALDFAVINRHDQAERTAERSLRRAAARLNHEGNQQ